MIVTSHPLIGEEDKKQPVRKVDGVSSVIFSLIYVMSKCMALVIVKLVLWIRILIGSGFNGVLGSVYGSGFTIRIRIQEGKNDP
jgi:hypothetical protein